MDQHEAERRQKRLAVAQEHADNVAKAAHALDVAVIEAARAGLTVKIQILEIEQVGREPRPQLEVMTFMPLEGRTR